MWPVDCSASPAKPGQAKSDPSGPIVCACALWISHGPMCTPSTVVNPRFFVSSRRNAIFSSTKLQVSQTRLTPVPADVMHAPFSGLPSAPTDGQRDHALGCAGFFSRMIGLKVTFASLSRELLLREEVEQRRIAVGRVDSSKLPPIAIRRQVGDRADVRDDLVERALAAAQRPHPVVRVAVAVERDLDAVQAAAALSRSTISRRQQQAVGDDVDQHADAARLRTPRQQPLGEVVEHRQVQQRLAAEERQHEALRR